MNDLQIRNAIKEQEFKNHYNDPDTRIIDELGVCLGESIVDIAVINGSLSGYEIKSDVDTLRRLPRQIENYNKVFDYMSIVTSQKYAPIINDYIPDWWGIIEVEDNAGAVIVTEKRKPIQNKQVELFYLVQLLWKDELIKIIDSYNLNKSKKNKSKREIWTYLTEVIDNNMLKDIVRQYIKQRTKWREF